MYVGVEGGIVCVCVCVWGGGGGGVVYEGKCVWHERMCVVSIVC